MVDKTKKILGVEMGHLFNVEEWYDCLNKNLRILERISTQGLHYFDIDTIILLEYATYAVASSYKMRRLPTRIIH